MSKRKKTTPVKHQESNNSSIMGSSSSKQVTFNIPSDEEKDEDEENESPKKRRRSDNKLRKIIYTKPPKNCICLGEISFRIDDNDSTFDLEGLKLVLLKNDAELKVEISSLLWKSKKYLKLVIPEEVSWERMNDLFQRNYVWVVKNISGGVFDLDIIVTPEKTPILKATAVVELFFDKNYSEYENVARKKINYTEEFFKELKNFQQEILKYEEKDVQHEKLLPTLRPYQARAVQWMLEREKEELLTQKDDWMDVVVDKLVTKCGKTLYYNLYSKVLSVNLFELPDFPKSGVLADEMGLGKTVAVIALVLNHPRSIENETDNNEYLLGDQKNSRVVRRKSSEFHHDETIIEENKEGCLDPHEKLLFNPAKKGSMLKRALTEWYESKLASYSGIKNKKRSRMDEDEYSIKCVCGDGNNVEGDCIQCPDCLKFQHLKCVGYDQDFVYYCPACWAKQKLVKSKGTLVIAPASIYNQWKEEITKHVDEDALEKGCYMYNGVKDGFVQPSVLASYDIVITTYATLGAEINRATPNESGRKLRNEERFLRQCSPLIQVQWWRICLDEAQMVEKDTSVISQMAKLIPTVNRWSVTGTPIQKSIGDLYYLIDWLGVEPFNERVLWENFLYLPFLNENKSPLYSVLSQIFWRNSKEDVAGELTIPEQTTKYHFLKFTAIEQNFYMREHATSSKEFGEGLRKLKLDMNQTLDNLDRHTISRVLSPLLNLRQACSHPLAVRGNKISTKTGSMTLSELLKYLQTKTTNECEDALRSHVASLNGLAGIYCIQEEWPEAVDNYRKVLQITEEYKEKVKVDTLQQIHALTNLAEILEKNGQGIPPTLRDDKLKIDAKILEDKYMQKVTEEYDSNQIFLKKLTEKVETLTKNFESGAEIWWVRLIHLITIDESLDEFMDKIMNEFSADETENKKNIDLFLARIASVEGIEILIRNWLEDLERNRDSAVDDLEELCNAECDDLVYEAIDCHLRTFTYENVKKKKCRLCTCESLLLDYECSLFATSRKNLKEQYLKVINGAVTKGTWKPHNAERILNVILNYSKLKNLAAGDERFCIKDGKNHCNLLKIMKKEFKQLRVVWRMLNHQVQARDELSMSKLRLRLRLPGEPIPPKPTELSMKELNKKEMIYIIEHHEVGIQKLKLKADSDLYISEFKKKYGTLLYLGNLGEKDSNPDPCPICRSALENEWCVLQCGHSFCIECIRTILTRNVRPSVSCPVCRETTSASDISFVDLSNRDENPDINVVGEHSTKVDAILRTLIELKQTDPHVKVLIFSTWEVVLKVLEKALDQNNISFRRMPGYNYQIHLKQFKDPEMNVTALLLPISWGSKGLNLVEASHVFLVEPIMNPAEELQAIGRVHRIGQTKETVVHRFLVNGTVEEKIHSAVSEAKDKWDKKTVTLEDLKNLFLVNNDFTN